MDMMPEGEVITYCLYGDPAYPQSRYIVGGYMHPEPGTEQQLFNTGMSTVRKCVEWGFNGIISQWRFLDLKATMQIFKMPIAKYFVIAFF